VFSLHEYIKADDRSSALNLVRIKSADIDSEDFGLLPLDKSLVFVLETDALHGMGDQRTFFLKMEEMELDVPVIIKRSYSLTPNPSPEEKDLNKKVSPAGGDLEGAATQNLQLYSSTDLGALLVDGFGDGIWID